MTHKEAIANYKYDRAIDLIRRIKAEETHEREIDRHKAFDLAISALEKQIPKKPLPYKGYEGQCPECGVVYLDRLTGYCGNCGQKLFWETENE